MNQLIREGTLTGWRYFDSPRRFNGTDYGTQKGWKRIRDEPVQMTMNVNEGVSTNEGFIEVSEDFDLPF